MNAPLPAGRVKLVIVGAGPAGLSAGAEAARRGFSHVVLERAAAIADTIQKYHRGKAVMDSPQHLRLQPTHPLTFQPGSREKVLGGFEASVAKAGLMIRLCQEVTRISGSSPDFTVTALDRSATGLGEPAEVTFTAEYVIVAMGTQGNIRKLTDRRTKPPSAPPGRELPYVIYQLDDPAAFQRKAIVVVGAGDSAIENALALANRDLENGVYLVYDRNGFGNARTANQTAIRRAIDEKRVAFHPNTTITRLEDLGGRCRVTLEGPSRVEYDVDQVICRLGADPPKEFLRAAGVAFKTRDPRERAERSPRFETNRPGLFVVGATGDSNLIKTAMNEGLEVVAAIAGQPLVPMDVEQLGQKIAAPWGIEGATAAARVEEAVERIRRIVPLFHEVSTLALRGLLFNNCEVFRPDPRKAIFETKQYGTDLYVVLEGSVTGRLAIGDRVRTATHPPGDFLGVLNLFQDGYHEGSALAAPDTIILRVPRTRLLQAASSAFSIRTQLDLAFTLRKLQNLFEAGGDDTEGLRDRLTVLAQAAEIQAWNKGDAVFREGEEPDGLHLIRRGSVAITQESGDGSPTFLAFRPAGAVIGEMALIEAHAKRSATAIATVPSETVRIPQAELGALFTQFPACRTALRDLKSLRLIENGAHIGRAGGGDLVGLLRDAGAGEATNILLIDDSLCVRCDNCETACAATHGGVLRLDREAGRTFAGVHVPTTCRHCSNALCMSDCPPDVIHRAATGEVTIDLEGCIHCGACARNCPYGVIQMQPPPPSVLERLFPRWFGNNGKEANPVKCDLCEGLHGRAACEVACPTGAIVRTDPADYLRQLLGDA